MERRIFMSINWGVFVTPEFLVGTLVVGLLLHVVGTYMVRSLDWVIKVLPASFRSAQEAESARIQKLTAAATSDHALYAALSADASRIRSHMLQHFFFSFVCFFTMLLLVWLADSGQV